MWPAHASATVATSSSAACGPDWKNDAALTCSTAPATDLVHDGRRPDADVGWQPTEPRRTTRPAGVDERRTFAGGDADAQRDLGAGVEAQRTEQVRQRRVGDEAVVERDDPVIVGAAQADAATRRRRPGARVVRYAHGSTAPAAVTDGIRQPGGAAQRVADDLDLQRQLLVGRDVLPRAAPQPSASAGHGGWIRNGDGLDDAPDRRRGRSRAAPRRTSAATVSPVIDAPTKTTRPSSR